ncbi:hypothetical protein [Flavobacterium aestivum]|uniref:hypothetical protein n=1 Tax=Flavobacterium aestivum TaxID=3003257 RepID=UPI002482F52E|nr:hypothetical protein [Flavobacterium aestivum]
MKNNYFILSFFFILLIACTNKNKSKDNVISSKDSLSSYLSLANDIRLPLKSKQQYNQKAFEIIIAQKDDSINKVNLFKIANRYYNMNDWKGYFDTSKLILERSKNSNDTANIAKSYTYLGDYYTAKSISDSAFLCYFKAEKLYVKIGNNYNLIRGNTKHTL